jgi:hypothetical protein
MSRYQLVLEKINKLWYNYSTKEVRQWVQKIEYSLYW